MLGQTVDTALEPIQVHDLPAQPLDLELTGEGEGYITLSDGRVSRFALRGDRLELATVVDGPQYPRGVAVLNDMLVVGEVIDLPCPDPVSMCKGEQLPGADVASGMRNVYNLAFDPDGRLWQLGADELPEKRLS